MASKVLITYPHGIGDVVMLMPALHLYKKENPDTEISLGLLWRIHEQNFRLKSDVVKNYHWVSNPHDDFDDYMNAMQQGMMHESQALARVNGYDNVIICGMSMQDGAGNRLPIHRCVKAALDIGVDPQKLENRRYEFESSDFKVDTDKPIAVIHQKGGRLDKGLTDETTKLAIELLKNKGYYIVLLDTHHGLPWNDKYTKNHAVDLCVSAVPGFDLKALSSLSNQAKIFIGCDSGPMHLFSMMGVKSIGLFMDTWAHQSAPMYDNCHIVLSRQARAQCHPEWVQDNMARVTFEVDGEFNESLKRLVK